MNKTDIEWCDYTWNPITGCLHGCEYCYARGIAHRFNGAGYPCCGDDYDGYDLVELNEPYTWTDEYGEKHNIAYPADFKPTLHRYRLDEPKKTNVIKIPNVGCALNVFGNPIRQESKTRPANIFVGSMADIFGEWVPDEWIRAVFEACEAIPRHRYLFLTKNPARYKALAMAGKLPVLEGQDETVTAEKSEVEPEGPGLTLPVQPKQTI